MKKKLLVLSVLALSGISTATLASCDKFAGSTTVTPSESIQKTITGISVTGQNTEYGIGDSIVQGAGARVSVNYSDGTSSDSTATAKFDFSAVDASKAGKYTVKVTCQGKETSYEVEVKEYVFTGIEADTSKADLNYYLYSVYNFDDVVINALYKHPVTNEVTKKALNNADVAFKVTDSNNTEIGTQFLAFGDYNVEASYNDAKCNFAVKCVTVDAKTIAEAMEVASKTESSIASGSAVYESTLGDDSQIATDSYDYIYGNSFVKVKHVNSYTGLKTNLYYSVKSNGEPFVVAVDLDADGNETGSPYIPTDLEFNPEAIDAQYLPLNIFKDGTKYNGLYNTINRLYKDLDGVVGDPHQEVGECPHLDNANGFKFGYNRLRSAYGKWYYEKVTVEFTLTEGGAINKAYIQIDEYYSDENPGYGEKDYEAGTATPSDLPIEIKEGTDEAGLTKKYFVFKKDVEATPSDSSNWKFNQESAIKASDDENPYLASKINVSDFKIYDADGNELEDGKNVSLDLDNGNSTKDEGNHRFELSFTVGDVLPTTANIDLDAINVDVSGQGKDGHVVEDSDYGYAFASKSDGKIVVRFNRPGDYDVIFKTSTVTKTIHYSVDYEAPLTIQGTVHNGEENSSFTPEGTFAMYKSNKIYIGANIGDKNGANADVFEPGFTAAVDKTTGLLEKTTLNVNGKDVECYAFTATEAGDYVLTLTGATPDSDRKAATTTLTITVEENPTLASILAKYDNKYEAVVSNEEMYSLVFTDNKFTLYNKYDHTKYAEYEYTYDETTREFVLIPGDTKGIDKNFELSMSNYYVLSLVDSDTNASYILKKPTSDITDEDLALLKGKYTGTHPNYGFIYTFVFTPGDEKGTGSLVVSEDQGNGSAKDYTYTYEFDSKTRKLVPTYTGKEKNHPLKYGVVSINNDSQLVFTYGGSDIILESQSTDYSQMFNGTYETTVEYNGMSQVFEFQFTANTDDAKTGTLVCITDGDSSKSGTYTYSLDETTGAIKVTKISGKNKYIEDCLSFVNGNIYLTKYNNDFELSRKGGSDTPDTPEEIEIPDEYLGIWLDEYDNKLTLTKNSFTIEGDASYSIIKVTKDSAGVITIEGKGTYSNLTLTIENGSMVDSYEYSYTYIGSETPSEIVIPDSYIGSWVSDDGSTLVITADGVEYNEEAIDVISASSNGGIEVDNFGTSGVIFFDSDGVLNFRNGSNVITFKKNNSSSSNYIDAFIGKWMDEEFNVITITSTSATIDGGTYNISNVTSDTLELAYVDDPTYKVTLTLTSDGKLTDGTLEFTKYNSSNTPTVEIDESLQGTWKDDAVYEGSYNSETEKLELRQGTTNWYYFSKQDSSSDSDTVDFSSYIGAWSHGDDSEIFIGNSVVEIDGNEYTITNVTEADGVITLTITSAYVDEPKTITLSSGTLSYDNLTYAKEAN